MGALKPAEAVAPATPSKEDSERSIENGETLSLLSTTLRNPHTDPSEERFYNGGSENGERQENG